MGAPGTTKGPWAVGFRAYDVTAADGQMKVCDIRGWGHLTGKGSGALGLSDEEGIAIQTANAHQIAASGALYDALQEMWDTSCTNATSTPSKAAFLKAHAALKMARGEKS